MRPLTIWLTTAFSVVAIVASNQANIAAGGEKTGTPGTTPGGAVAESDGTTTPPADALVPLPAEVPAPPAAEPPPPAAEPPPADPTEASEASSGDPEQPGEPPAPGLSTSKPPRPGDTNEHGTR